MSNLVDGIYALGVLSGIHLALAAYTGMSVNKNRTIEREKDPERYRLDMLSSMTFVCIACLTAVISWLSAFV